jgi:hypothetical protein
LRVNWGNAMNEKSWKWLALGSLGAVLLLVALALDKGLLRFLLPGGSVLQTAHVALFRSERQSQLVTTRAFVQAVVRQRDEAWYGNAEVIRIVPATIHYAVNLAEIDRAGLEYDAKSATLYVPLPEVRVLSIDPDLARAETIRNLDLLRTEAETGNQLEEATEKMVRPALEQLGKSSDAMQTAKEHAVMSVRQLLETVLATAGHRVAVQPYFKSDGKPAR